MLLFDAQIRLNIGFHGMILLKLIGSLKRVYCRLSGKDTLEVTVTIGVSFHDHRMMGRSSNNHRYIHSELYRKLYKPVDADFNKP